MLTLTTRQKIALARMVQRAVMTGRRAAGRTSVTEVTRRGLRWRLDLREGIDFSIWLLGAFEPGTVRTYERLLAPGSHVLDIGANVGAHTLPLARLVGPQGRVYAVEPTDFAFSKLRANLALNPELESRVVAVQAMLVAPGETAKPGALYASWPLAAGGEHHPLHLGELKGCDGARAVTLDDLVEELRPPRIDLVKVDIDGHECAMFRGAGRALERLRPKVIMELAPYVLREHGGSTAELVELLVRAGYRLQDVETGRNLPLLAEHLESLIPRGGCRNVIALPA